ncbi:D-xylulose reductase A [Aspergillus flavus AF70]|nr:D-xylulose reductase A [Aspergillus flavus AF70]
MINKQNNPSLVLKAVQQLEFEDRPVPDLLEPYDVSVRIEYTGICGSDVHYWQRGRIGQFILEKPMVLGHESAGVVEKVGSKVESLAVGDHVALEPGVPCRRCTFCKAGNYNLCSEMAFAATPPFDGTLAKYYVLPEDFCYKLPTNVSLQEGAVVEPLSVAVHLVRQAALQPGQSVVVFGAGPVGLLCCAVARAFGASKVIVVDVQPKRLEFARAYAATAHFLPGVETSPADNAVRLREENELEMGADVVIEASGAEPSVYTGIHILRPGGTYVQGGMGKEEVKFPITAACTKELNIRGSFRYSSGDYKLAIELIAAGKINVKALITQVFKFEDAPRAFEEVKSGKGIKTLIAGPGV